MIELPTELVGITNQNPNLLVIYSPPKAGKTTAFSLLENNLILDFEKGSGYVKALKMNIDSLRTLKEVGKAILEKNRPYKYITVDTVTALEEMCVEYGGKLYRESPMGKNWGRFPEGHPNVGQIDPTANVLKLPNGAGYLYLREAFFKIIDYIKTLVPEGGCLILAGHLKDKMIEANGKEVSAVELDLTGKIKSLVCAKADAIALLSRKKNKVTLNFKTSQEVTCGARPEHLKNKEIVLTELNEDGSLQHNWDSIFLK